MNTQWSEKFPKCNKLLDALEGISDNTRKISEKTEFLFAGKESHETYEYIINEDLKLKLIAEMKRWLT